MKSAIVGLLVAFGVGQSVLGIEFGVNTRVDHQDSTLWACRLLDVAVVPGKTVPRVYVTFERDSPAGIPWRGDLMISKSTDGGATWIGDDTVAQGAFGNVAFYPQIAVDRWGRLLVTWRMAGHIWLSWSDDDGETWSAPISVSSMQGPLAMGWSRLVVRDSSVYVVWTDDRYMALNVMLAKSSDRGLSFGPNRHVTFSMIDRYHSDVCLDPRRPTNVYVACTAQDNADLRTELYRSTDDGNSFDFRTVVDSFHSNTGQPRLAADSNRLYVLFTGMADSSRVDSTRLRFSTDGGETFGRIYGVAPQDSGLNSYYNGANLAVDRFGSVHVCVMLNDMECPYNVYYERSTDGGQTFSRNAHVNQDTTGLNQEDGDLDVDEQGYAYVAWQHWGYDGQQSFEQIWFATNNPAVGLSEAPRVRGSMHADAATVVRGVLSLLPASGGGREASGLLLDISGRKVTDLHPGANDVRHLSPGVYFIREGQGAGDVGQGQVRKVVITR